MIPIKLEIEGLYSYREKQLIDFTQLTAAGLFGIFGAVGSGKSSILEAVLLALYGTTERLASKGEKNSMVNLQSPGIHINFEFKAGKNNAQTYKASYLARRNTKNFDDVKPATHTFYELNEGKWVPLEARGEDLVGMKMSHFRQTVIIPQGKFREFIEQKPKDRADMMKELFGLERFDLSEKTRRLLSAEKEKKIKLETQLEGLEAFSKEALQEAKEKEHALKQEKAKHEHILKEKEAALQQAKTVKEKAEKLTAQRQQLRELESQLPAFEQKRKQLDQYQKALTFLKPIIDQLQEQEIDLEKYQKSVGECERFKISLAEEVQQKEARYQKLYQDFSTKGEKEARIRDLLQIKALNELALQERKLQEQLHVLKEKTASFQNKKLNQETQIQKVEKEIEQLEVPEVELISQLESTSLALKQNTESIKRLSGQIESLKAEMANHQREMHLLLDDVDLQGNHFSDKLETVQSEWNELQKEREILLQQQGLYSYTQNLQDGQACPLCGSMEHPDPLSHQFDSEKLAQNEVRVKACKSYQEKLQKAKADYEKKQLLWEGQQKTYQEKHEELEGLSSQNERLIASIEGVDNQSGIERLLQSAKSNFQQEKALQQRLKEQNTAYKQFLKDSEKDLEKVQEAEQALKTLETQKETKLKEINYPDLLEKYRDVNAVKIEQDIAKVKEYLENLEINLPRAQDALKEIQQKQTTNLANLSTYQQRLEEVKAKLAQLKDRLSLAMAEHDFSDSVAVRELLGSKVDPTLLEEQIKAFDRQLDLTKAKILELSSDEAVASFDAGQFQSIISAFEEAKQALEGSQKTLSLLVNQIEEIKSRLEEKAKLTQQFKQVENREANLKELAGLFQGSGFVKYISNIYLKELVQTANLRFMKLAKNSLSLEVDENNTFWVQDHLNGGKKRLLKTLSGGQTFQASLCLALALAEKVKSLNRAEQSFFFLDEGFGALDKNALRTVFDTLKSLRHENRIVGIISHVEELQQEIGVFAQIELDPETGSQVSYSY
ncbi:SMC family ATPase [Echinicola sp. CAU 1574]|uniref:SMC family ATPase n=1 Tax=Echinicola arenosa TaxID=2774144 RepID=A0ABR9ALY9_9BACT|nr:SMC family ATPase [Echinicola arenosa]MBD8489811.1 SMC family ATPase [Echinicola arenosa]